MENLSSPYIALPVPEKLVKIRPIVSENLMLQGRPLKKEKKNVSKIYSPPANMPGRFKKLVSIWRSYGIVSCFWTHSVLGELKK